MLVIMPKRPVYLLALVLAAALAVRFTGPELLKRFETSFAAAQERDLSAQSRIDLWRDCFTVMVENPVTGIGPRHWPLVAASYGWPEGRRLTRIGWKSGPRSARRAALSHRLLRLFAAACLAIVAATR
jgi:O-antigen ligase